MNGVPPPKILGLTVLGCSLIIKSFELVQRDLSILDLDLFGLSFSLYPTSDHSLHILCKQRNLKNIAASFIRSYYGEMIGKVHARVWRQMALITTAQGSGTTAV